MIDKRTKLGKIIDQDKVVYRCISCKIEFVESIGRVKACPNCNGELVIEQNLLVIK